MKTLPLLRVCALLALAAASASAATTLGVSNPAPITINDNTTASPYPSNVTVSNPSLTTVTRVQVVLTQFSHTFPDDVDIVLVGPGGRRTMLMSDAGGGNPGVTNINLTFSPVATNPLPDTALSGGTFRPANYETAVDNFPAPGPGALTNEPADLSVFNLTNPNGVWSLYVVDDAGQDVGSIAGGWTLVLTLPVVFTVNSAADTSDGTCDAANCTLREAMAAASDGDLINFSPLFNTPQTINLLTALPNIATSVTIQGPGANLLTVRRDYNATDFRIFNILSGISNVAISGMTITGGRVSDFGGGIFSQSNLILTNVHITGNQAGGGGGVALAFSDGVFTGCTFSGNLASSNSAGGAILYQGDGGHTLRFTNSTVSGNRSLGTAGGIENASAGGNSRLEVTSSTIVNNVATAGGGIETIAQGAGNTATTTLRNTIVANNSGGNLANTSEDGTPTTITNGFNLSDNFNGVFTPLGTDITSATPRLGPLSLGGGKTPTHALLGGSPALDAGNASGQATDQRGINRAFDTTGVPNASDGSDIGAVEMRAVIVTTAANGGTGSLRNTIANTIGDSSLTDIIFDPAVFNTPQTINLLSALFDITSSLTINGPGANLLTVRRDSAAANFRIFNIASGITGGVAISGITVTGGRAIGDFGGGIFSQSNLTLTNVHLTGNQASNDSGGGVALVFADGVFTGCTFSGNTAGLDGGGIFYQGDGGRTLRLINSTVSGNNSGNNIGGGIINLSSGGNSRLEVVSSTITGNNGGTVGGGIVTFTQGAGNTATTTLRNTIIAGNTPNNLATGTAGGGATTVTTHGFNLANDNGGGFLNVAPITTDKPNANAALAPLALNGGTTPTRLLLFGSAALDAGNNTGSGLTTDQRGAGFRRTVDLPGIGNAPGSDGTDIGALELAGGPFRITSIVRLPNAHILLQGSSEPGRAVTIQAAPDPNAASFSNLMPAATADAAGFWQYDDAGAIGQTKRFYRATLP